MGCWTKTFQGEGKQICGSKNNGWNEAKVKVTCTAAAVKGSFAVRVYTSLNSAANDESFAIDNAVLTKVADPPKCKATQYLKANKCTACPKTSTCDGKKATACKSPKIVKTNKCVDAPFKTIKTNFKDSKDMDGWNCVKVQNCGSLGSVCGGYNTKGKSHDIKKTFTKLPAGNYQISLDFIKIDSWDNEKAYVTVNGKQCWTKTFQGEGKQICGSKNNGWNEAKVKVTCVAAAVKGSFAVRGYTSLNSAANDESFAIDNAVLSKYVAPKFKTISTNFKDAKDMDGWNCVKVQNCGSLGSVCGGYNTKGKS